MNKYTIKPLNTGFVSTNKANYIYHHSTHRYYDVSGDVDLPVFTFYVEGYGKKILVDTGMAPTEIANKYHHKGSYQPEGMAIYEQLEKIGVNPEDIDIVILTHLHWDHCYHLKMFKNARFYVQKEEYEFAKNPIPLYYKSYEYPAIGIKPQFEGVDFELIEGESEIESGIYVYPSPGHSVGHQTVVVNTGEGEYHCCGDLVFVYDNFKEIPEIHYTITPPARFQDIVKSWKSIEDCKNRVKGKIEMVLPTHELSLVNRKVIG